MNKMELVKEFIEHNFEDFQLWLEEVHEIEGSEAERILDDIENEI